jgi:hypothetical protein
VVDGVTVDVPYPSLSFDTDCPFSFILTSDSDVVLYEGIDYTLENKVLTVINPGDYKFYF